MPKFLQPVFDGQRGYVDDDKSLIFEDMKLPKGTTVEAQVPGKLGFTLRRKIGVVMKTPNDGMIEVRLPNGRSLISGDNVAVVDKYPFLDLKRDRRSDSPNVPTQIDLAESEETFQAALNIYERRMEQMSESMSEQRAWIILQAIKFPDSSPCPFRVNDNLDTAIQAAMAADYKLSGIYMPDTPTRWVSVAGYGQGSGKLNSVSVVEPQYRSDIESAVKTLLAKFEPLPRGTNNI